LPNGAEHTGGNRAFGHPVWSDSVHDRMHPRRRRRAVIGQATRQAVYYRWRRRKSALESGRSGAAFRKAMGRRPSWLGEWSHNDETGCRKRHGSSAWDHGLCGRGDHIGQRWLKRSEGYESLGRYGSCPASRPGIPDPDAVASLCQGRCPVPRQAPQQPDRDRQIQQIPGKTVEKGRTVGQGRVEDRAGHPPADRHPRERCR
jgi:hypothetical protein